MQPPTDIDREVRQALSDGDRDAAVARLLSAYGDEVFGYLVAIVKDEEAARDVYSAFTEMLLGAVTEFRFRSSCRTYVYALARSAACRHLRHPRLRRELPIELHPSAAEVAAPVRTVTAPHQQSAPRKVAALKATLSEEEQSILTLRVSRSMEWRDIALVIDGEAQGAQLTQRAAALRKRFERIKAKLREQAVAAGLLEVR